MTMVSRVFYDEVGRITGQEMGSADTLLPAENCLEVPLDFVMTGHYIKDAQPVLRPALNVELDGLTLRGVPAGAQLLVEDSTYLADGTDIQLEFAYPGTYPILIECWPYLETTIEVTT